jgi:dihydrodipicolinate synthase/N-acetylneuraminate lyase
MKLSGVFNVLQTPLTETDEIDEPVFAREIEWLLKCGIDGAVLAMVSEVLRFSAEDRRKQWQLVLKLIDGRIPVIASVGAESTYIATSLAKWAEIDGAAAVMATPPSAFATLSNEIRDYYVAIIESVKIPVIVQDASNYLGQPLDISLYVDLIDKYGAERVQFKPEAKPVKERLELLRDASGGRALVFEGQGGVDLLDTFPIGIVGTMPGAEVPWALVALFKALKEDNWDRARSIHAPLAKLISYQKTLDAYVAVEKYLLVKQGIFTSTRQRGPVGFILSDEMKVEIDIAFDQLKAAVDKK